MSLEIISTPNFNQLNEIKNWLSDESQKYNEGFFCNWKAVMRYFENNQLIILVKDLNVIGFTTWYIHDKIALNIDIAEIHPDYRGNGYGKFMMHETFNFCKTKGAIVAKLFCAPSSSYEFWKSLGFKDMPEIGNDLPKLSLYMPLIDVLETINYENSESNTIELWNCEPYNITGVTASWIWSINPIKNKISPPILIPCNRDWNIRYSQNGRTIHEDKVKRFSIKNPIVFDSFIYINELNYEDFK
jgi:GNAT superfamily N-acetyltransferase